MIFILSSALAQEAKRETLSSKDSNLSYGGFGGPVIKITHLDGNYGALLIGGKGALIIEHNYYIGAAGYALAIPFSYKSSSDSIEESALAYGYGGLIFGYIIQPNKKIHFSTQLLLGASNSFYYDTDFSKDTYTVPDFYFSFVSELEVTAVFNVSDHFNIETGFGYRYGASNPLLSSSQQSGYSANIAFIFGDF